MLDSYYSQFIQTLPHYSIKMKAIGGYYFLYVRSNENETKTKESIQSAASDITKQTLLTFECESVRTVNGIHVFRFRFLVPREKMFCCGNECPNCIRF
ncbi:hypothetical protein [Alkalicoccobacillus plakortidis]|uniref:Uncharacterized protein n=1 Tax=Alkalicoccobacillus plakortidis TaxID=444060 RepID=A0ABT0XG44_9BACI|nr:hypothetical protein [Alkalicoccobacillus plakortidis]MCM2674844.1 hypothetical protein [Alkalicoccobacillus plakortidis]